MHETIFALKRAYQATRNTIDEGLMKYGINWAQLDILLLLFKHEAKTQKDLQIALGITSATLTRTIEGLVKRELVQQTVCEEDGRIKNLILTHKANDLLDHLQADEDILLREYFFAGFSVPEVNLLTEWLTRIAHNMGDKSENKF
jgi:DNA-binding MarR family transcriptional regulator